MQARNLARLARLTGQRYVSPTSARASGSLTPYRGFFVLSSRRGKAEAVLQDSGEEVKLEPAPRVNEPTDKKRARLLWQSRKRGILETCVILGKFAKEYLPTLSREELDEYDLFMNENDWDIYYWVTETPEAPKPCPERWQNSSVLAKLRKVGRNEKREIMQQPELY